MRDYAELVKALRYCSTNDSDTPCNKQCPYYDKRDGYECIWEMMRKTADAIEDVVAMRNVLKSRLAQLEKAEYESGDCAETYKNGFLSGKRQGAIELLREILGIDVDEPPKEDAE